MVNIEQFERRYQHTLLSEIKQFMGGRFSGIPLEDYIDGDGYHMAFQSVEYVMNFEYEVNTGKIGFSLNATLPKTQEGLEEILDKNRESNRKLDQTTYLSNQTITTDNTKVEISCRLKKNPQEGKEFKDFNTQLWAKIIQPVMISTAGYIKPSKR